MVRLDFRRLVITEGCFNNMKVVVNKPLEPHAVSITLEKVSLLASWPMMKSTLHFSKSLQFFYTLEFSNRTKLNLSFLKLTLLTRKIQATAGEVALAAIHKYIKPLTGLQTNEQT